MDSIVRIQAIKSQIENMNLQIDNIQNQNNIMDMMNNNQIGEQLLNLSFQLLNTGIQSFNEGKNMITIIDTNKFYERLKNISKQINLIINQNDMNIMQQQMMMQQQQMMMQQQQMMPMQFLPPMMNKKVEYINVIFRRTDGLQTLISEKFGTKVSELLNKYMRKIYGGSTNVKIKFIENALEISKNNQRKIEDYFHGRPQPNIFVIETG